MEQLLKIAEKAVKDYQTFLAMKLPASKDQAVKLESEDMMFQLLLIAMKFRLEQMTIEEVDYTYLKKVILRLCNVQGLIFSTSCDYLAKAFLHFKHFMIARVFLMLNNHTIFLAKKSEDGEILSLITSLDYMETLMSTSVEMMKHDSTWTKEQAAREKIFEDVLETMNVEVNNQFKK